MNVILGNSTRRMIDQSPARVQAEGFIAWLRAAWPHTFSTLQIQSHLSH